MRDLRFTKGFNTIEGDMDYVTQEKRFTGRLTKKRYKILQRYVRRNSPGSLPYCGHEWDCCGCMCGKRMTMEVKKGALFFTIKITRTFNFNY